MGATSAPKPDARRQREAIARAQSANRVPVAGRLGRPPNPPIELGEDGRRWWKWAWSTPQACKWHKGFHESLARRASLEDEYAKATSSPDLSAAPRLLAFMIRLDDAFGLTPLGAAKQHIVFVDEEPAAKPDKAPGTVTPIRNRLKGMRDT